jgi:hypothetical protein
VPRQATVHLMIEVVVPPKESALLDSSLAIFVLEVVRRQVRQTRFSSLVYERNPTVRSMLVSGFGM